ncbi:MAG: hypothetical protein J6C53_00170 [Clostridia bacterium]|nr:hypothetical protein [Clostridia bacterium]
MSLKAKLISTISAMCLVIALVSVGVWAASTATVNLSGTLTFSATDVYCDVSGTFAGMKDTAPSLATLKWDSKSTAANTPTTGDVSTWAGNALNFKDDGTAITLTITIKNNSTERGIKVKLDDTAATTTGLSRTVKYGATVATATNTYTDASAQTLVKSASTSSKSTLVFVITFALTDANLDKTLTNAPYAYTLTLNNAG